ncbi:MAG: hypothetical protein R3C01_08225 [Planctomycetaceae bacterium]
MKFATLSSMITIAHDTLPRTRLTYVAFRIAFCETLERIVLADQFQLERDTPFGYLTEVPFLRQVPPQVQLDLLLDTWSRHVATEEVRATLVDESVVYAVCETSSRLVKNDAVAVRRFLQGGPCEVELDLSTKLARSILSVHLNLKNDGNFLLLSQFLDLPPRDAKLLKAEFGLSEADCEPMFEVLGRWHVLPDIAARAKGLLTPREILGLGRVLPMATIQPTE